MGFNEPLLLQKMDAQMSYLSERQSLLAQNVANIDTPSYRAQDLKKLDFNEMLSTETNRLPMAATSAGHLTGTMDTGGHYSAIKERKTVEKKLLGNNINLEEQLGKISDVSAQHQLTSSLIHKYNQLYTTALDSHGS